MQRIIQSVILLSLLAINALPHDPLTFQDVQNVQNPIEEPSVFPNQFLVQLRSGVKIEEHKLEFIDSLVDQVPLLKLMHTFDIDSFQGYAIEIPQPTNGTLSMTSQLMRASQQLMSILRSNPQVELVEYNQRCEIAATQKNAPWNLDRISKRNPPLNGKYVYPNSAGSGVDVYIFDTGIRVTHEEFEGRATFGASFNDEPGTDDDNGHGTHVAGTVAGKTFGVAKKANVISVRVLKADGSGRWDVLLKSFDWLMKQYKESKRPTVINLSLSGGKSNILNNALNNLVRAGIFVAAAAGNNGIDACLESPASASLVATTAASTYEDGLYDKSNHGKCVDIIAPGVGVLSSWSSDDKSTMYMIGTSMASPHVAGVAALYMNDKVSAETLRSTILRNSTRDKLKSLPKSTVNRLLFNSPPRS